MMSDACVFVPSNVLTFDTVSSDLTRFSAHLKQQANPTLVLNMEHVTHCDSAGLALLIQAHRLCQEQSVTLRIQGMSQAILDLATFCDVDNLLLEKIE
jgi:phospholipid transport system transporter-binding protein|tara:strand:+ start:46466 stop:46759 length:294 start_codon:yes stop_codon:yes gene_type:complete